MDETKGNRIYSLITYGYTNEFYDTYIKLIYLRSRYYSSGTGRFLTRDIWEGNGNSPMSFNGWNYANGNPVNQTDPSGYCSFSPSKNVEYVERIVKLPKWDWLNTYTAAGIAVQCWATIYDFNANDDYDGLGPGKITNIQIETSYGVRIPNPEDPKNDKKNRGYGLLCYIIRKLDENTGSVVPCTICKTATEMDSIYGVGNYEQETPHNQTEEKWAVEYMRRRIKLVTDVCVSAGCSSTAIYIAAALAQNGSGFTLFNLTDWLIVKKNRLNKGGATLNWWLYFEHPNNADDTSAQLSRFKSATDALKTWYIPRDVNKDTIRELLNIGN